MKDLKRKLVLYKILKIIALITLVGALIIFIANIIISFGFNFFVIKDNTAKADPLTVLIGGADVGGNRDAETKGVRTDALMVATINPKNQRGNFEANITSIPRDTVVPIACGQPQKINAASSVGYLYPATDDMSPMEGAVDCTVQTVEDLLDIKIDNYIFANFDAFIKLVDAVGSITINNTRQFCEQDENGNKNAYCFDEGKIDLKSGAEALAYVRQRHGDSDYYRTQRQQAVISKVVVKTLKNPKKYAKTLIDIMLNDTMTNFDLSTLTNLANWGANTYNQVLDQLAYNIPVYIDVKGSQYSQQTSIDPFELLTGHKSSSETIYLNEIYDTYKEFETNTWVDRYAITKNALGIPTSNDKPNQEFNIEIQFNTLPVEDIHDDSGYYSQPVPDGLEYVSELLKQGVLKK